MSGAEEELNEASVCSCDVATCMDVVPLDQAHKALAEARREGLLWAVAELEKRIQSEAETGSLMNAVAHIRKEAGDGRG